MPGFYISNIQEETTLSNVFADNCICGDIQNSLYTIRRNTLNRFLEDKLFYEDSQYIIITEGVILNKKKLIEQYKQVDFASCVIRMAEQNEQTFYSEFRGSFSGAIYYKSKDKWLVYTNHIGDKPVFYYASEKTFCIGSQPNYILDMLRKTDVTLSLCEKAAYFMLAYGCIPDDSTYVNEIKRLSPGDYILIEQGEIQIRSYWTLEHNRFDCSTLSEDQMIDILDEKFKDSIRLAYDKDLEYGYRHLADLSGGLDSRMANWVAHEMGYRGGLYTTYCQSNYLDEIIAKQIAADLKQEIIVKTLDDASFIYDVDSLISLQYGAASYSAGTGMKRTLETLNLSFFGLKHTGQIGDIVLSSSLRRRREKNRVPDLISTSPILCPKIDREHLRAFSDPEIYQMMAVYGFRGVLSTNLMVQNFTESFAPFQDVDFLEFCFSIPVEKRIHHRIYTKWILRKHPSAAKYKWEKINAKISRFHWVNRVSFYFYRFPRICSELLAMKGLRMSRNTVGGSMHPFDTWYRNNATMRTFIEDYYCTHKDLLPKNSALEADVSQLYQSGRNCDKLLVLSLLGALSYYFPQKS